MVVAGANGRVTRDYVVRARAAIEGAAALMLQLELPEEAVEAAIEVADAAGVPIVLDPAPVREVPAAVLGRVTWLTPNVSEAGYLLRRELDAGDEAAVLRAAAELLECGCAGVVLKLGEQGVAVARRDGLRVRVPGFVVEAVDTTAAGDAFNAGWTGALVRGLGVEAAAAWGCAVAAVSVTRRGALPSLPTRAEVEAFVRSGPGRRAV